MPPMISEIRLVPFDFAPRGWMFCDGALLPISENESLFQILGNTYGGDGESTFAIPNLTAAMEKSGWPEARIRGVIGDNWLRFLADAWGG